jgi:hypothetical protein
MQLFHGIVPRVAKLREFFARQILEQVVILFFAKRERILERFAPG